MSAQDRMPKRLGGYRLLDRIGEGGMGVVYLASGPDGRKAALKVLRAAVAGDPTARQRLAREVETMRRVRSPHVAEVLDADLTGDTPYIVTRYVPGRTLDAVVTEDGPLRGEALARLACGLAEALVAVHAAGVVHRDVKPSNVMLLNGSPVVIDFGIAQAPDATRLTLTGMFMGTPGYLSPEVIEGRPSSEASDVHAWGATVAFATTGRPPFGTGPYETVFYRIVNGRPDLAGVPTVMLPLVASAMARDPVHRPRAASLSARAATLNAASLVPGPAGLAGDGPARAARAEMAAGATRAEMPAGAGTSADGPGPAGARDGGLAPGVLANGVPAGGGPGAGGTAAPGRGAGGRGGEPALGGPTAGRAAVDGTAVDGTAVDGTAVDGTAVDGTAVDGTAWAGVPFPAHPFRGAPSATRPLGGPAPPDDYADVLPPVRYGPPGADGNAGAPTGRDARQDGLSAGARSRLHPLLVLAAVLAAVGVSVVLPVAGTAAALVAIMLLRAGELSQRRGRLREAARGPRTSDPLLSVVAFPWYLVRSVLASLLLAPAALAVAAVAGAASVVALPGQTVARALAYAAGGLVAFYGFGPGSGRSRRQLGRVFAPAVRGRAAQAVAVIGMGAFAAAAVAAAVSGPSLYWPASAPVRLPYLGKLSYLGRLRHLGLAGYLYLRHRHGL